MTLHTVIGIGYSNVSVLQIRALLEREREPGGFDVIQITHLHDEARPYALGKAEAQDIACLLAKHYRAQLCIGIVCVRFVPENPTFNSARLDIAMTVKRGVIEDKEIELNPKTRRRELTRGFQKESEFAHEASHNLLEFVRVRQRALLGEHF